MSEIAKETGSGAEGTATLDVLLSTLVEKTVVADMRFGMTDEVVPESEPELEYV